MEPTCFGLSESKPCGQQLVAIHPVTPWLLFVCVCVQFHTDKRRHEQWKHVASQNVDGHDWIQIPHISGGLGGRHVDCSSLAD